jgi:hypothetical protein
LGATSGEPTITAEPEAARTKPGKALGGNGVGLLPAGHQGQIEVVATGTYDGNTLPVIVRNNSDKAISSIKVTATVKNAAGNLIAAGGDQGLRPGTLAPGDYALGYLYFDGAELPTDATFEFDVASTLASDDRFNAIYDLTIIEANYLDGRIVGFLQNDTDKTVQGVGITVLCMDPQGAITGEQTGYLDKDEVVPRAKSAFQVDFYDLTCETFVVAASGYSF